MSGVELKSLAPEDALKFFRDKGYRVSFDHRDMEREEHAYNFTVAKAMSNDLLQDIRGALDDALSQGQTLDQFKKTLTPKLQDRGWWGTIPLTDPQTGEEKLVRAGSSRRLKTIFDTNMRTAYAAGQWEQITRSKDIFPYLLYVHTPSKHERKEHAALHNTCLPVDDPFWKTFYPPNGWGCKCRVRQIAPEDLERLGINLSKSAPSLPIKNYTNTRTGEIQRVPQGIDPGFNYNVGQARMKALVPPQLDRPLEVPFSGKAASVAMPPIRKAVANLLPDGLTEQEYVNRFLSEFGASQSRSEVFEDVTGEKLIISDDLFKEGRTGKLKVTKRLRHRHLALLAQTIKEPDEIWHMWQEYPKGRMTLLRRYVSRVNVDGEDVAAFTLFDTGKDGWTGVTTLKPDEIKYLEKERKGTLVYSRPKK